MQNKVLNKLKDILVKSWPYLIILVASMLGCYLVFYHGIIKGHDYKFHVANVIEQYETLINTGSLSPISGIVAMGLGNGTRLFYAPLPHLTVTIMAIIISIFGGTIHTAFKITLVLSVFLSGIFMYRFAMHFSKNNRFAGILAAICFVLFPYRIMDAFTRFAWAETYAIVFLPLFFMGLYDICHIKKDDLATIPFVETVLGAALLFLSHNITALYAYVFGVIYLLCNIKNLISLFKTYQYWTHCLVSVGLIIMVTAVSLFSQMELLGTNNYVVSNNEAMWTDYEHVADRTSQIWVFSGFLNIKSLSYWFKEVFSKSELIWSVVLFIIGVIVAIVCDVFLGKVKHMKHYSFFIGVGLLFGIVSIYGRRIEVYLAAIAFTILYGFIKYLKIEDNKPDEKDKIWKNPLFYFSIGSIIVLMVLIGCKWPWKILPEIFLKIQFPWRLWGLIQLFISILIGLLVAYLNWKKVASYTACGFACLLLVVNNPLPDRRGCYEIKYDELWSSEVDYGLLDGGVAIGFNKEYVTKTLLDKDYKPIYDDSLWYKIAPIIRYNFDEYEDYQYPPAILGGTGSVTVNKCFAPNYDMEINITSDNAIIQMPLIYYPGYVINATNANNETIKLNGEELDGLVSFKLEKGTYDVATSFKGSTLRQVGLSFTITGSILTGGAILYGLFFEKKVRDKIAKRKEAKIASSNE